MSNITTGTIEQIDKPLKENYNKIFIFNLDANDVEADFDNDSLVISVKGKKLSPVERIIQSIIEAKTPEDVDKLINDIIADKQKLKMIVAEYTQRFKEHYKY